MVVLGVVAVAAGFVEAVLLALIATVAFALSQGAGQVVVDIGPTGLEASFSTSLVVGFLLAALRAALTLWLAYLPATLSAAAMTELRKRLFDSFVAAEWTIKSTERDGHFQSLMMGQIPQAASAIIAFSSGISAAIMFATLLLSALVLSLPAAIVLLVSSTVLFVALRPLSRRLRRHAKLLSAENIEYAKNVQEVTLVAEELQVFGASAMYKRSFHEKIDEVRKPLLRTRFLTGALPSLYQSIALLLLLVALGAIFALDPDNLGALGAVVILLVRAQYYGQRVQTAISSLDEKVPFIWHLFEAIEKYDSYAQRDDGDPLPGVEKLGMRDVYYSYDAGKEVLKGISFDASIGEAVGIVGPSGAGKSSLVQILLRLRDPDSGSLRINGLDAARFRRDDWQGRVAYVPQSPQLIWGTVADNIRFYRAHLSQKEIEAAAKQAHIHEEILTWPDGYDTYIGQRVSAVSGGQRQRICIARALATTPEVLVLDEPTSALDARSEELVQESMRLIRGHALLFIVAHRLSTLTICDRVMVVVDGELQAIDDPLALQESNAFYRQISAISRRDQVS